MSSTIYDIRLRYTTDDKASKGIAAIASVSDRANKSLGGLKTALVGLGAGAALLAGKRMLIDYNSEIDQMKIGMSTVMSMQMHKPFQAARKEADLLVTNLQELAKKSPATTKDFVEMASSIAPAVAMMGGGIGKLESLSAGAVTAGLATGTRADVAALDIQQMLMGTVSMRDRMARQLISSKGMDHTEFNKMGAKERAGMTEELLNSPALKAAADAMGASFAGQVSTFKDQLQIAIGKVGLPLMTQMTSQVQKWNTWIERHPREIARYTKQLSGMLTSSFNFLRETAAFFVEHKELLMGIAKVFLVFKAGQYAQGIMGNVIGGLTRMGTGLKQVGGVFAGFLSGSGGLKGVTGAFGGLTRVLMGAGGVIPIFGALATAAFSLFNAFGVGAERRRREEMGGRLNEVIGERTKALNRQKELSTWIKAHEVGPLTGFQDDPATRKERERKQAELDAIRKQHGFGRDQNFMYQTTDATKQADATMLRSLREENSMLANAIREDFSGFDRQFLVNLQNSKGYDSQRTAELITVLEDIFARNNTDELYKLAHPEIYGAKEDIKPEEEWKAPTREGMDMNVTIHKIEVQSPDPDRFVFGMVNTLGQAAKNPTQAEHVITGGF